LRVLPRRSEEVESGLNPIITQPAKQAELAPRLPKCQFAARIEMIANFKAA